MIHKLVNMGFNMFEKIQKWPVVPAHGHGQMPRVSFAEANVDLLGSIFLDLDLLLQQRGSEWWFRSVDICAVSVPVDHQKSLVICQYP
jgi:hypothetical protein